MTQKLDPKDCKNLHCWHPHPTDPSRSVCFYCGTEQGGRPAEEAMP